MCTTLRTPDGDEIETMGRLRESSHPGIGAWAEDFLLDVFRRLVDAGAVPSVPRRLGAEDLG